MPSTLEFIIQCAGDIKGAVDVKEADTLEDVRKKIEEELDDDLIPVPGFGFHVNGIRISQKQERKKRAWDLLDEHISIRGKRTRAATTMNVGQEMQAIKPSEKRLKTEKVDYGQPEGIMSAQVTPGPASVLMNTTRSAKRRECTDNVKLPPCNSSGIGKVSDSVDDVTIKSKRLGNDFAKVVDNLSPLTKDTRERVKHEQSLQHRESKEIYEDVGVHGMASKTDKVSLNVNENTGLKEENEQIANEVEALDNLADKLLDVNEHTVTQEETEQLVKAVKVPGLANQTDKLLDVNEYTVMNKENGQIAQAVKTSGLTNQANKLLDVNEYSGMKEETEQPVKELKESGLTNQADKLLDANENTVVQEETEQFVKLVKAPGLAITADKLLDVNEHKVKQEEIKQLTKEVEVLGLNNMANRLLDVKEHTSRQNETEQLVNTIEASGLANQADKLLDVNEHVAIFNITGKLVSKILGSNNTTKPSTKAVDGAKIGKQQLDEKDHKLNEEDFPMQDDINDDTNKVLQEMEVSPSTIGMTSARNEGFSSLRPNKDKEDVKMSAPEDGLLVSDEEENTKLVAERTANPNQEADQALEASRAVLTSMRTILGSNPSFCSEDRRQEWSKEISDILGSSSSKTIVGVLGNTGVGKSSLLNALLDEAAVLPTSGSRGCTAAVVELRFNSDIETSNESRKEVSVYKGEVEFMTLQEWQTELQILLDECSNQQKYVYAVEPDPQNQSEAAAAWSKIDQVYGSGTMNRCKKETTNQVFNRLSNHFQIKKLLTPSRESTHPYNIIPVEEGKVVPGTPSAKTLVGSFQQMNARTRRSKKKWANAFRSKINSYVYRKGHGNEAQTWPLIRKVVLHGPWAVLSTGACLVDLPGVRDANAARAKVSEHYLQHCNQIWVVAPIKRAVDDGTAKELLGEQFKRRLLMDGQYGNVSFICTQTDDCEATEIMRDHADVAQSVPGRWEQMNKILTEISNLENELSALTEVEDDLKFNLEEASSDIQNEPNENERIAAAILKEWRDTNQSQIKEMQIMCQVQQRKLKTLCAHCRNEYSKGCLQADFRAGLKDLYRHSDTEEDNIRNQTAPETALPENFEMDVFCISANDYLKIQGIKNKSDGPPNTFSLAEHTQIPNLRMFVHKTTSHEGIRYAKRFVNNASDILDRVKLLAVDAGNVPSGRSSLQCMTHFRNEVNRLVEIIQNFTQDFTNKMESKVKTSLQPALQNGATKGIAAAIPICKSWGNKSRRSRHLRDPDHNGLYWGTYMATIRRGGVYASMCAGPVDMNQELCDPMEKEFSTDWQRTMDNAIRTHLADCENQVQNICSSINQAIASAFIKKGKNKAQLMNMSNTANRSCTNAVKIAFDLMRNVASSTQRNLNRSLLPLVQAHMQAGYASGLSVPRGPGSFNRMKNAMETAAQCNVQSMFDGSIIQLLKGIDNLVKQLVTLISESGQTISKHLENVYSICWDDQEQAKMIDPEMQGKVRASRDSLLPTLNKLWKNLDTARNLMGIEREELDLDVMAVESLDNTIKRKLDEATCNGEVIDLCNSDEEIDTILSRLPAETPLLSQVKAEPTSNDSSDISISDCDSDDCIDLLD